MMVRQITPRELAKQLANGHPVSLIDVRQAWENQLASLPGSQLIPLNELAQRIQEITPPPDTPVIVYCHHGIRSQSAADFLDRAGIGNVSSLSGGIDAWSCEVDPSVPRY
jgi:rhodanese-related sulfurtransferase